MSYVSSKSKIGDVQIRPVLVGPVTYKINMLTILIANNSCFPLHTEHTQFLQSKSLLQTNTLIKLFTDDQVKMYMVR